MAKNMVKDLSDEQLAIILEPNESGDPRGFVGKTLGEFIEHQMLENGTLTSLYEEMNCWGLKWPFRLVYIDVEARTSRRYTIGVLEDTTMDAIQKWSASEIFELDPNFKLEQAFEEAYLAAMEVGDVCYDYAIITDDDRVILDWDN